jgi:hypothetical protein
MIEVKMFFLNNNIDIMLISIPITRKHYLKVDLTILLDILYNTSKRHNT